MSHESSIMEMKKQRINTSPEKSQAELRTALEQKLLAEKPRLDHVMNEYGKALTDNTFEDQEGEDEGSGEKRKAGMQQHILTIITRAEKMKKMLDSGETLKDIPEADTEALQQTNEQFILNTFETWYNKQDAAKAKQEAILIAPESQDHKALSKSTEPAEFGKYTLNPETQHLDFEQLKTFIPDLSKFNGKPLHEVIQHVMDTYSNTHYVPGIEYWKWLCENPGKSPPNLKDGNWYFFPGSVLRGRDGRWSVSDADWSGSEWNRNALWLTSAWNDNCRVVLLEK